MFGKAKRAADVAQVILSTFALAILLVSWSLGTYAVGAGWLIAVLAIIMGFALVMAVVSLLVSE